MTSFMAVCLGLIVLELGLVCAFLILTLLKVKRAAEAAEVLAFRLDQEVATIGSAMRSGWWRALEGLLSFAGTLWGGRRRG